MALINTNPFTTWLKWYFVTKILLVKEKEKHLKIGHMSCLSNVEVGNYNTIYDNVFISDSVLNDFVYISGGTKINNTVIGKFCSIGPDVKIGVGKHPTNFISTFPAFYSNRGQAQIIFADKTYFRETGNIIIGNDVWIGANAIIMDDIIIGDGAIIAAGAVVTKNVEPYSIIGGVPAHLIRKRFSEEEISFLLKFRWWDKEINWLRRNHVYLNYPDKFFNIENKI
jgi:acetyltransferase-like isoleucine patch superfamily enzyme